MTRPPCPVCGGFLDHKPADVLGPERVKCMQCGWLLERMVAAKPLPPEELFSGEDKVSSTENKLSDVIIDADTWVKTDKLDKLDKEDEMTEQAPAVKKSPRGDCPECNRKDVLMPGPKCSRCYDRLRRGVDVITGECVPPLQTHELVPSIVKAPAKQAAPKVTLKDPAAVLVKRSATDPLSIDPVECVDALWRNLRNSFIRKLSGSTSALDRLETALCMVEDLKELQDEYAN